MAARMLVSRAARRGGLVLDAALLLALTAPTPAHAQSAPWAAPRSEVRPA